MKYNRVLLVRLAYIGYLANVEIFPVGLGYIAESLKKAGIGYRVLDLGLESYKKEAPLLMKEISEYKPDLVGIAMMTLGYKEHYLLIDSIKQSFPDVKIVIGGAHISTFREKVLEECKNVDYGIVLEGEESIVELCQGKAPHEIKGLVYRSDGNVVYTGDREFIKDLDSVPYPLYQELNLDNYSPNMPTVTSRGCPHMCTYCPVYLAIGRRFFVRSASSVIEEMDYWYRRGYRKFNIWDDNFSLIKSRVYEICDLIETKGLKDISIDIPNGVRADKVDRNMLARMKEVGFYQISFGVESASNKVLKNLRKGETVEDNERAIAAACDLGYEVYLFFIIGSPGETWQDFEESLVLAQKYPVAEARFHTLIPFPGTELFEWVKEKGYFVRSPDDYLNKIPHFVPEPCFATPEMSKEERIKAFNIGWKITLNQRRNCRTKQLKRLGVFSRLVALITISDAYHRMRKPTWFRKCVLKPIKKFAFRT